MSLAEDRAPLNAKLWRGGVVLAAALVFAVLVGIGKLPVIYAVAGFAVIAAAAVVGLRSAREQDRFAQPVVNVQTGDDLLRTFVAGLPDPVLALDRDGRVIALNDRARALAPALRQGEPVSFALRTPELIEAIGRASRDGEEQRVVYSERVPLDRWYETVVTPVKRQANARSPDLVLMTFHDLTPLRRVEEMRADFVANASHELRTPLAALLGFIETLQGSAREDPKARERFLSIMQEQARRMARLIDDLLSLSRIELNAHRRPDTPVDLAPIIRQVSDGLEGLARDRGVAVNVENALKYGAAGRRVDIKLGPGSSAEGEPEARVSVRDYGPGIAPEHLPRLTERFYRVDVTESRAQGGTGLGLALVKHILNRHRGRLTIDSTPGAGATFTVHLPTAIALPAR